MVTVTGVDFLLFESVAYGDIIGLRSKTHMLRSKRSCARGQAEGECGAGVVVFEEEEPDPTVYTGSPSSRAKEMFSEKKKDTVHPQKHVWRRIKERSLDERRRSESGSRVSLPS